MREYANSTGQYIIKCPAKALRLRGCQSHAPGTYSHTLPRSHNHSATEVPRIELETETRKSKRARCPSWVWKKQKSRSPRNFYTLNGRVHVMFTVGACRELGSNLTYCSNFRIVTSKRAHSLAGSPNHFLTLGATRKVPWSRFFPKNTLSLLWRRSTLNFKFSLQMPAKSTPKTLRE